MKNRRPALAVILAGIVIAGACGGDDDTAGNEPSTAATEAAGAPTEEPATEEPAAEQPAATEAAAEPAVGDCGAPASGEPIRIGHLNIAGLGVDIPSSGYATEVYFDQLNACGGANGRPLELVARSGGADPATSAAAARELVEEEGVIAFVATNAFLDCVANGQYYLDNEIPVIGSSFDQSCYSNDVIFPTVPDFDRNIFPGIAYTLEQGATSFAYMALDVPGQRAQAEAIRTYLADNGASLDAEVFLAFGPNDPTTPIAQIREAGVDVVIASADELTLSTFLPAASQQGVGPADITWLGPTALYSPRSLALLGDVGEGMLVLVNQDVAEHGNTTAAEIDELILAKYPDAEPDGFALVGWIAAEVFGAAIRSIDGEVTSASILEAMNGLGPVQSELLPGPIEVNGPQPRRITAYGLVLRMTAGEYEVLTPEFLTYPEG
jgi:branched-chain amino acid transport system substrate-binding protein